jgi:transcriptional regulator with XRE-family HTH domain
MLKLPRDNMKDIEDRAKARRLSLNLTQEGLATRSGVNLGTLKQFEHKRLGKCNLTLCFLKGLLLFHKMGSLFFRK